MREVIELYRNVVIQIATPYSTGTGFYLKEPGLIVTNGHIVTGNREVIVKGEGMEKQLVRVIYSDPKYDLAFLEVTNAPDLPRVDLGVEDKVAEGDPVVAIGHPFGLKFSTTQGIVSNASHVRENDDVRYIQHDAALNPGNSGGPLINKIGHILGVNTFIIKDGDNMGFSLPAHYISETITAFQNAGNGVRTRCEGCSNIITEKEVENNKYCPHCGAKVELPSMAEEYQPVGVAMTVEELLDKAGHDVRLSRRGLNNWEILQGSARINISYHEETGLITGDAYLCMLPQENIKPLYEFLLRKNYEVEGLTFSIKSRDIILSLLIYDRYLNLSTGMKLFKHLFECADQYDNILVEEYGAQWKYEDGEEVE
ncbi:MAG: trypsin-like peptidase domain-containing protein [Lewinellaceae bacterium]|nr:trypsin-like peptidase domain-containing protein [Phaeodactylibacter sp.]MCB9039848.1 trypsin-like peptidase domain-containing protein [Lewinellaceae bacterium]